jgi:hypothetical protein
MIKLIRVQRKNWKESKFSIDGMKNLNYSK